MTVNPFYAEDIFLRVAVVYRIGLILSPVFAYRLLVFAGELVLKFAIVGFGKFFDWHNHDFYWNAFDLFIVGLGASDCAMSLLKGTHNGGFATLFRIIRLLRILRIFRIIKFLKQLYPYLD